MPASLIAVARTPWAPRHTALDGSRPEDLLEVALAGVVERADIDPHTIDRVLVACDTSVGAQDLNLGRRAARQAGWVHTPALTVDGHGATGLALVALAAELPGTTIVAGVDASSMVPPGAGLVRDYGRPTLDEPEHRWLDSVAGAHDLDAMALDRAVARAREAASLTSPATIAVRPDGPVTDTRADQEVAEPFSPDGIVAPQHLAPWADGAVAVLIGPGGERLIVHAGLEAVPDTELITRLTEPSRQEHLIVADHSAVVAALTGPSPTGVASPLAVGSTPSCDGLRALADAAVTITRSVEVRTRGGNGQVARVVLGGSGQAAAVELGGQAPPTDASKPHQPT